MIKVIERAQLLTTDGIRLGDVEASVWKNEIARGFVDWGGGFQPQSDLEDLVSGSYALEFADGRHVRILVNNVRVTGPKEHQSVVAATFLGDDEPPI